MNETTDPSERLRTIATKLRTGEAPPSPTVREFLGWFGAQRRGYRIANRIQEALKLAGLSTNPDFEATWLDGQISFGPTGQPPMTGADKTEPGAADTGSLVQQARPPRATINQLSAAHQPVESVRPNSTLREAVTIMIKRDFSQVPVMPTEREVKGVVTWQSIASRITLGRDVSEAGKAMDKHVEISPDYSFFEAIPILEKHGYALVRGENQRITGIVTPSDLNRQLQKLAEPYLLLGEIENWIRKLIEPQIPSNELIRWRDPGDDQRAINSVDDMNFGEYIRLLQEQGTWERVGLPVDRKRFVQDLERVRVIRNEVMHFDTDPITEDDTNHLREVARLLTRLETIGV